MKHWNTRRVTVSRFGTIYVRTRNALTIWDTDAAGRRSARTIARDPIARPSLKSPMPLTADQVRAMFAAKDSARHVG